MGLADVFSAEDRVQVKYSDFFEIIREAAAAELLINAVKTNVPHEYILNMVTGEKIKDEEAAQHE